jgi:glycosyltransferase involved in cell wall biosynthesis
MHLLIDALSVNNLSGRHVLVGHVSQLVGVMGDRCRFTVLVGTSNADLIEHMPASVRVHRVPVGSGWLQRIVWMARNGESMCQDLKVDAVFSPSGMLSAGCDRPQVVLAQNPWPLIAGMSSGIERLKALLQRRAFAKAQRKARIMVFNSRYMLELYAAKLGRREAASVVAYQGIDESMFVLGMQAPVLAQREAMVLSVSVMARHKAVENVVVAFHLLLARIPDARLVLAGGWPEAGYRQEIEDLVDRLGINGSVQITGHVDEETLHRLYGSARVFCLLSRCESFGIPAVEAQAFGTPAIVAEGTAAPEVIGAGGRAVGQDDAQATVSCLQVFMTDDALWNECSAAARKNAERFHWPICSAPLIQAIETLSHEFD